MALGGRGKLGPPSFLAVLSLGVLRSESCLFFHGSKCRSHISRLRVYQLTAPEALTPRDMSAGLMVTVHQGVAQMSG